MGTLLNSARGFRAIAQNRFPIEEIRRGIPWHYNIADIQNRIDPSLDLSLGARDLAESFHSFDLIQDDRTALSMRRENNAREQLAVDLTLSKDVYSPSPFIRPREVDHDLETMTEALSLSENDIREPPEMEFGYLVPVSQRKKSYHEEEAKIKIEAPTGKVSLPMGVRLLLKDWEVGTKAKDYVFRDPYSTTDGSDSHSTVYSVLQGVTTVPSMLQFMNSQQPPTIMSSQASGLGLVNQPAQQPSTMFHIELPSSRSTGTQLQDEPLMLQTLQGYPQQLEQYTPSTQVFLGPHDERQKKKPPKKRLGGF